MENNTKLSGDAKLRLTVVRLVLDFHRDKGADPKRIKEDLDLIYKFIKDDNK